MRYQPWKPWNPWGLSESEQAAQALAGFGVLVIFCGFALWNGCVKDKHIKEPVKVTQSPKTTPNHQVWHVEDNRGAFKETYDFIVAKNADDSAYAKEESLDLGAFLSSKELTVSERAYKGRGWCAPETMNYTIVK